MLCVGWVLAVLRCRVAHRSGEQVGLGRFAVFDDAAVRALGRTTRNVARIDLVELGEAMAVVLGDRWRGRLQPQLGRLLELIGRHLAQ